MDLRGTRTRRVLAPAMAVAALVVATSSATSPASAGPAVPTPTPVTHPGGLTPTQLRTQARTGFRPAAARATAAVCGNGTIHCKPGYSGSCTGYSSQSTPPATIRVLVHTSSTKTSIQAVPFETYVENVLPNEWVAGWDGDSLKAGAVAVKSYAWYWVTHYGGYVGATATSTDCFDVTDDTSFQVYRANSAQPRTTTAVQATWPYRLTQNGQVFQAGYAAYLNNSSESCGADANGYQLSQWGSQNCVEANTGNKFPVILEAYYAGVQLATSRQLTTLHDFVYDQTSSKVTWDAATGNWSIDDGYPTTLRYGLPGDIPTVMTTGDGFARVGVFRPSNGTWYVGNATGHTAKTVPFGTSGGHPGAGPVQRRRPADGHRRVAPVDGGLVPRRAGRFDRHAGGVRSAGRRPGARATTAAAPTRSRSSARRPGLVVRRRPRRRTTGRAATSRCPPTTTATARRTRRVPAVHPPVLHQGPRAA